MYHSHLIQPDAQSSLTTWLDYLLAGHPTEIDMGLNRITDVAQRMDLLTSSSKVITVAGTNGKGTTCAYLERILRQAGYSVGVYSSPHIINYNERVRIDGVDASDAEFIRAFLAIEAARIDISLTFFECATLAALYIFKQRQPDYILLEVGLGGRLDATNIIDADVSVLTAVDIDHTNFLGNTRDSVGREKAGIFRSNRPAVIGEPDLPDSVTEVVQYLDAVSYCVGQQFSYQQQDDSWSYQGTVLHIENMPLPSLPLPNAATAIAVIEQILPALSPELIANALASATLAGRLELVQQQPKVLVDVAHNPHAAAYLVKKLQQMQYRKLVALCGMLSDKDIHGVLQLMTPIVDSWHFVTLDNERGATAAELSKQLPESVSACEYHNLDDAWQAIAPTLADDDLLIVFGSFYTVAGFKMLLQPNEK